MWGSECSTMGHCIKFCNLGYELDGIDFMSVLKFNATQHSFVLTNFVVNSEFVGHPRVASVTCKCYNLMFVMHRFIGYIINFS